MSSECTRWFPALIVLLALLTPACNRGPERPFEIVALIHFEDLGSAGQPAVGRALAALAAERSTGDRKHRVTMVPTRRDAEMLHATRTIAGWYEVRNGQIEVHGSVRDEAAGKVVKTFDLAGSESELGRIANSIASETGAPLRTDPMPKAEAVLALERGLPDEALRADPGFGAAHVARIEALLRDSNKEAMAAAVQAARAARLTETDKARLDLAEARLKGSAPEQAAALKRLSATQTANIELMRALFEVQFQVRDFKGALETTGQLLELNPTDEDILNRRGYLYAFLGDLPGARKAFDEYRKRRPESANAIDSMAEVLFYFRRYDEAAGLFLEAHKKNAGIVNGAEPFRAALSYALAGNLKEADTEIGKYFQSRKADPLLPLRQALWAKMTGRNATMPATGPGLATAALFALRDGDRAKAAEMAAVARKQAGTPPEATLAFLAGVLSQPSADAATWKARVDAITVNPAQAQIRTELLGWSLLLDGKYADAAAVWAPVFEQASPLSSNDSRMLLFWSFAQGGQKDQALKVMPQGWYPPAGLDPGLGMLLYPKIPELRTKL